MRPAFPYGNRFVTSRGAGRLPAGHELDPGLSRAFGLGKTSQVRLTLGIQNALDTETVTEVNGSADDQGRPLERQTQRRYELGGRAVHVLITKRRSGPRWRLRTSPSRTTRAARILLH